MLVALLSLLGSGTFVAAVGFIFSLGTRVTKLEAHQEDLPQFIEVQFDSVNKRLDRIERAMNGALKHVE